MPFNVHLILTFFILSAAERGTDIVSEINKFCPRSELHTLRTIKTCHKIHGHVHETAVEMVLEAEGGYRRWLPVFGGIPVPLQATRVYGKPTNTLSTYYTFWQELLIMASKIRRLMTIAGDGTWKPYDSAVTEAAHIMTTTREPLVSSIKSKRRQKTLHP